MLAMIPLRAYIQSIEANNPEQNEMNTQATANALFALKEEMKSCPVNKSGTYNGNGRGKRVDTCAIALQAAGWDRGESYDMAYKAAPKAP